MLLMVENQIYYKLEGDLCFNRKYKEINPKLIGIILSKLITETVLRKI